MESRIRLLAAPKLDQASNLGSRLLCHRPCRRGPPRMDIEKREMAKGGAKGMAMMMTIAHNYGHAGSGLTMAPGAVQHVNGLLMREIEKEAGSDPREQPIVVLGAGMIGLFTAYDFVKRGQRDVSVVAEHFEELASHNAGGLLSPTAMEIEDGDTDGQALVDKICMDAYKYYANIARGEHPDLSAECAKFMPFYCDPGATKSMDPYVRAGIMCAPKEVNVQFADCGPSTRRMMVYDDALFIESHGTMHSLRDWLHSNGVKFVQRRVSTLDELECRWAVNCSGMGARQLCNDQKMHSVQGHLILLRDQNPADLNYMLVHWLPTVINERGQEVTRAFYIFPKRSSGTDERAIGVIGGTFIDEANESTPNAEEFDLVLENARKFLESDEGD